MKTSGIGMRALALALACALTGVVAGPAAQAAGAEQSREVRGLEAVALMAVDGNLVIEPDGSVSGVKLSTKIDPELAANIEKAVRTWRFRPVKIGGEPRRVNTSLRLQLAATRQEGQRFSVRIDSIDFPDASDKKAVRPDNQPELITGKKLGPPQYPSELLMRGMMGAVMLAIRVTPEGTAGDVMVVQSHLYDTGRASLMSRVSLTQFENSAVRAARRWTFNVPQGGARDAKAMTVTVPVAYSMSGVSLDMPGRWLQVQRTAKQQIAWLPAEQSRSGPSLAAAGGGSVSQFGVGPQLEQDVAGMSLQ